MNGDELMLGCRASVGPGGSGRLLVSRDGFSPRYDLDRNTGKFDRRDHDLFGACVAGYVCAFDHAKGGVAAGWALHDLACRGVGPVGLIFRRINPVFVQGAVVAKIPIAHVGSNEWECLIQLPSDFYCEIEPGQRRMLLYRLSSPEFDQSGQSASARNHTRSSPTDLG